MTIVGIIGNKISGQITDVRLQSLHSDIKSVERNSADRLLEEDDTRRFIGIPHNGLTLHVFFLTGDHEAERFARSIKQELGLGLHWSVDIGSLDEGRLGTGLIPGMIFGPFGGDQNNRAVSTATIMLYSSFLMSDFCINMGVPLSIQELAAPSSTVISLLVGPKDRRSSDCR